MPARPRLAMGSRASEAVPLALTCGGAVLLALLAASVGVDVGVVPLDESLHKLQAVRYADGFPGAFVSDPLARSTARLYSLAIAPVFVFTGGDTAIGAARVVSALLFASAAVPTFLLARETVTSRWLPALAAVMSVAAPWLTLSTALYTENLAYPLFVWAAWAITRSVRAPTARRDVIALGLIGLAIGTRTQLACLFVAYVVLVAVRLLRDRPQSVGLAVREAVRAFPATSALLAVGLIGVLAGGLAGKLDVVLDKGLGPYRGITQREAAPSDLSLAFSTELAAIGLGVGVLPAVLATGWVANVLRRPMTRAWWPALTGVVLVIVVWATALFAQGGYLGPATEERYFVYAVPMLWIGAVAALQDPSLRRGTLAAAALPFVVAFATVPLNVGLNPDTEFLAPVLAVAGNIAARVVGGVPGLGSHDVLVLAAVVVVGTSLVVWHPPRARGAVLALPIALQLALAVYAFAAVAGDVPGVAGRVGDDLEQRAWVDEAVGRAREVTLVRGGTATDRELELNFWNGGVRHFVDPPEAGLTMLPYPLYFLDDERAAVADDGGVSLRELRGRAVQDPRSTQLQLAGRRLATESAGTLELIEPVQPARARWATKGLDADGFVARPVELFATPPSGRGRFAATFELEPPENAATSLTIRLGAIVREVELPVAVPPTPVRVRISGCGATRGRLEPKVSSALPDGRQVAGKLVRVEVRQIGGDCPSGR